MEDQSPSFAGFPVPRRWRPPAGSPAARCQRRRHSGRPAPSFSGLLALQPRFQPLLSDVVRDVGAVTGEKGGQVIVGLDPSPALL